MVFAGIPALKLPIQRFHAAEKFSSHAKIYLAGGAVKILWSPPLHHVFRVCPRLPNQFAWGIKYSLVHVWSWSQAAPAPDRRYVLKSFAARVQTAPPSHAPWQAHG